MDTTLYPGFDLPDSALPPNDTGWSRECVYWNDTNGGCYGDSAEGTAFVSRYVKGNDCIECNYYVQKVLTTNLPEIREAFVVEDCTTWGTLEDPSGGGSQYDSASPLYYDTLLQAECVARACAMRDERFYLV